MTPTVYLADPDMTLWHGDALDVLAELADGSVDCVISSPPYWGLRDYGTGAWEGGNPECEHSVGGQVQDNKAPGAIVTGQRPGVDASTCRKCGATRTDQQLGLEPTPDLYIENMVAVFREVWRVLADHGTCWVNMGDSYAGGNQGGTYNPETWKGLPDPPAGWTKRQQRTTLDMKAAGLKPKDLVGVPWKLAFALQADGWYLRAEIIWAKPNPMPESVTDRPTKSHEQVFLLTKRPRYFYDAEAVREPHGGKPSGNVTPTWVPTSGTPVKHSIPWAPGSEPDPDVLTIGDLPPEAPRGADGRRVTTRTTGPDSHDNYQKFGHEEGRERWPNGGRNLRSVWEIATQPFVGAHFATFPEALVRRCLLAGCPEWVCATCGKPRERIVERVGFPEPEPQGADLEPLRVTNNDADRRRVLSGQRHAAFKAENPDRDMGWSDCGHGNYRPGHVLDPFMGSGTVAKVARDHGRHSIGIDLNADYLELAADRTKQQSLLATAPPTERGDA